MSTAVVTATPRRTERALAGSALGATLLLALLTLASSPVPELISRFGLRADVADSIARVISALGYVPWWALAVIGGGIAAVVVRLVIQYGWRYVVAW